MGQSELTRQELLDLLIDSQRLKLEAVDRLILRLEKFLDEAEDALESVTSSSKSVKG